MIADGDISIVPGQIAMEKLIHLSKSKTTVVDFFLMNN